MVLTLHHSVNPLILFYFIQFWIALFFAFLYLFFDIWSELLLKKSHYIRFWSECMKKRPTVIQHELIHKVWLNKTLLLYTLDIFSCTFLWSNYQQNSNCSWQIFHICNTCLLLADLAPDWSPQWDHFHDVWERKQTCAPLLCFCWLHHCLGCGPVLEENARRSCYIVKHCSNFYLFFFLFVFFPPVIELYWKIYSVRYLVNVNKAAI